MQLIELRLSGKLLHFKNGSRQFFEVVADNDDYCFKFYFDTPRETAVAAIMEMYGNPYTVLLDDDDMVKIPRGVLIGGKRLHVGLSWGEDLTAQLITSSDLEIAVRYSIRSRLRNTKPLEPAQADIIAQFSALVNKIKNVDSVYQDENGHLILKLTNGSTIDCGEVKGAKGDTYILTENDKKEIADIVLSAIPTAEGESYPQIPDAEGVQF